MSRDGECGDLCEVVCRGMVSVGICVRACVEGWCVSRDGECGDLCEGVCRGMVCVKGWDLCEGVCRGMMSV